MLYSVNLFSYTVDEFTNENCTVTPLHPSFLTAAGGLLYNGTSNVMIKCNCPNADDDDIRWYSQNLKEIPADYEHTKLNGFPYIVQENGTLIIPIFTELYEGIYYCGAGNDSMFSANIQLNLFTGKCGPMKVATTFINLYSQYTAAVAMCTLFK